MPKSVKKNTHKKRNFKKTRNYNKTRNLRKTVKHNKRNFKKTRKYKGGVFLELPWAKRKRQERERQERERQEREEEEVRKKAQEDEKEAIQTYSNNVILDQQNAYDTFKKQYDEKNKEDKLELWKVWAEKNNIPDTYTPEDKIRAVNKGILYYYFKEYIKNPIIVEESCTYDINEIKTKISNFWGYGINKQIKSEQSNITFKTIKTPPN